MEKPLDNISSAPINDDLFNWEAVIIGPHESPYEGGLFKLSLKFTQEYPFKPPAVRFLTKIYHPNIDVNGHVCINMLKNKWSPANTVSSGRLL